MKYSKMISFGHYLPSRIMTNADLEKIVDTSDEWIKTRSGISSRHFTDENETTSTMAIKASNIAIEKAGIDRNEIDLIIVATVTADTRFPSTSTLVMKGLDLKHSVPCFDLSAACSGFVYGASVADSFIKSGQYKTILVIGSENLSKFIDMNDRASCVLFGDGAGAAIIQESEEPGIMSFFLASEGKFSDLIEFPADGSKNPTTEETLAKGMHYTKMEGREVYKQAVQNMSNAAIEALKKADLPISDITWVIPHQANIRIIQAVAKKLEIDMEKVFTNIDHVGNTSAASIPIALSEMLEKKLLKKGDNVVLTALGSGLTWGSIVFKW